MTESIFVTCIDYFSSLPLLELTAVLTSLLYVVLAAKGNVWCWPAAFISTVIYTAIFYDVYLWMDSLLQVYYLFMAVYGWFCWRNGNQQQVTAITKQVNIEQASAAPIQSWSINFHIKAITLLSLLSMVLGYLMATYTPAHFPYFDSATTVFAIFATYMVAKKVLENWLYWVVIDLVSIYLYQRKELTPTAVLFGLYAVIAAYGYYHWKKTFRAQVELA